MFIQCQKKIVCIFYLFSCKITNNNALGGYSLDGYSLDGCFLDGCFLDGCFLDGCFLDGCFLDGYSLDGYWFWLSQKNVGYFLDFEQVGN